MSRTSIAARDYAQMGWRVLPVDPVTKRPRTAHGVHDATNNMDIVRSWWEYDETSSIATPTGEGLLVIDIDPRNGGSRQSWMPETRTCRTQSGGLHLHYRVDRDIKSRANLFGPGLDSKSAGGYVLIPPSPGYEWLTLNPVAFLSQHAIESHVDTSYSPNGATGGVRRVNPQEWRKGMIHDQVIAWAAYLASEDVDDRDVVEGVWDLIRVANEHGAGIDNAGNHIDKAIEWVLLRERNGR